MKTSLAGPVAILLAASGAQAQQITGSACLTANAGAIECTVHVSGTAGSYRPRLNLRSLPGQLQFMQVTGWFEIGGCGSAAPSMRGPLSVTPLAQSTALTNRGLPMPAGACFKATLRCAEGTQMQSVSCAILTNLGAQVVLVPG